MAVDLVSERDAVSQCSFCRKFMVHSARDVAARRYLREVSAQSTEVQWSVEGQSRAIAISRYRKNKQILHHSLLTRGFQGRRARNVAEAVKNGFEEVKSNESDGPFQRVRWELARQYREYSALRRIVFRV
jgi:hypothetical protein